jgi:MFS transporter, PAT family, beta-lactamase induction signal transducer AmpG
MTKMARAMFNWRMLIILAMGIASGLPLLLIGSTLKAWCTEAGLDLTIIGFFSLVGLPYTFKFLLAPAFDRIVPPFLGRRRGWLLITQIGLIASLIALSMSDPKQSTVIVAALAFLIALFSATQDIAIDAYRVEILQPSEFGLGNSVYIMGYRLAMLFAGAFALFLADHIPWSTVYLIMGVTMSIGVITTFLCPEPVIDEPAPINWKEACIEPIAEFLKRPHIWWILGFITLYKVGDLMAAEMTMPFFLKTGFTKTDIATVVKIGGIIATIVGGLVGGAILMKIGMKRSLWLFGILQSVSTMLLAWIAQLGPSIPALWVVISFENLASGMGTAAYSAYMASLVNKKFTATQYAILTSLMGIPRVIIAAPTGYMAKHLGWQTFFITCGFAALPGLLILLKIGKWTSEVHESQRPPAEPEAFVS